MFIVIEGIDGAGKGEQGTRLVAYLQDLKLAVASSTFPDHKGVIYKQLIHPVLHEELQLTPKALFLAFALDQLLWQNKIQPAKGERNSHFIADGYFTTNIVYQCLMNKTMSLKEATDFATQFGMIVPDITVFIDVDPATALERKNKEEGHDEGLDIYERSLQKQQQIKQGFLRMAGGQIFGPWVVVDGSGSKETVQDNIIKALRLKKILS